MPIIGAVADDLTGATTVGVLLSKSGAKTAAFFNEVAALKCENVEEYSGIIVSSNSRALSKSEAYEKVQKATEALVKMNIKQFSKRTDTTMRGCIGVEIDAMLDLLGNGYVAIVVPAMPKSNRILVGGFSIIDGVPLIKTPVAKDVRTPVKENYIPDLIQKQTKRKVGLLTYDYVLSGVESIKLGLVYEKDKGNNIIVVDAVDDNDINMIANAVVELGWNVLAVDPGAFTERLAFYNGYLSTESVIKNEYKFDLDNMENETVLIAAGSATPVTQRQMEVLCEDTKNKRIYINPKELIEGGKRAELEVNKAVEKVLELLNGEDIPRALLLETALSGTLLNLDEEDKKHGYEKGACADRINSSLGYIIWLILEKIGKEKIAGLYMTGGDTMVSVCRQLGVECIEVIDYVIPQADVGRLVSKKYNNMPVVGKGGLTGNDNTAIDIVNRLFEESRKGRIVYENEEKDSWIKLENAY